MKKVLIISSIILITVLSIFIWKRCYSHENIPQQNKIQSITSSNYSTIQNLEIPCGNFEIINHTAYSLSYNEEHEQADWVAYQLTKQELTSNTERNNTFIVDPLISTNTATNKDYYKSGYDKGHLAPAADMKFSKIAMKESFYFSNMSPQAPEFNRGIWKELEEQVRNWALDFDTLYIVTGPILTKGLPSIGENEVSIPQYYYKAIIAYSNKNQSAIGFIMPNKKCTESIYLYVVSIDEIEKQTHLDLFCKLPDSIEKKIEKDILIDNWK